MRRPFRPVWSLCAAVVLGGAVVVACGSAFNGFTQKAPRVSHYETSRAHRLATLTPNPVEVALTTADGRYALTRLPDTAFVTGSASPNTEIVIDPRTRYQACPPALVVH